MLLGTVIFAAFHLYVGGVEVGNLVVGIDLDGFLEDCGVVVASLGIALGEGVEVDVAQTGRVGLEDLTYLLDGGVGAYRVGDGVVRMAQPRVDFL